MDWFSKAFIKASTVWLVLAMLLGMSMAMNPALVVYRPIHAHLMLVGFVTMMIFGVAYHVLPRFSGHPLYNARLAYAHWWFANIGLAIMVVGFRQQIANGWGHDWMLSAGGSLTALGVTIFAVQVWMTLDRRSAAVAPSPRPPVPLTR
ncbi:MAG: cbb3-type cytochrome c oxidase subunit I [Gemmatimonadaceae bacterium]